MLKIALTGPMGSGKSTLAEKLRLYGAYIADIDDIIKTHLQTNDTVINILHSEFGPTFIQEGQINLRLMYELFSKDAFSYSRFHKIIHPFIETTATELYNQVKKSNFKYFVLVAPYVIEDKNSLNRKFDFIVSVECSKENQINRLIKRTNLTKKSICDLIGLDTLTSERKLQANLVVQNDSNFKHIEILASKINNSIQKIGNTKKFFNLKGTILSILFFSGFSGALSADPCINTAIAAGTPITSSGSYTGNIGVCGISAKGIYLSNGNNSIVNMTGNITAINENSFASGTVGIYLENATLNNRNSIVNLTGNITTSGLDSIGIYLNNVSTTGSTNMVNMTGNISIAGGTSLYVNGGILMWNLVDSNIINTINTNTMNMTGNISGSDNYLAGISLYNIGTYGSTNSTSMTGNITLSGNNSWGINFYNNLLDPQLSGSNTLNMTGNITTSGNNSYGIKLFNNTDASSSGSNTVNITGHISATGSGSYAIYATNANSTGSNTVQLNKGSSVIGAISGVGNYTANNFLKLNLGAGASYSFATTGFTVQDLNGRPMVTGSAHAAGVGNITTASQSLYERTSQITQSLDDRLRTHDLKQQPSQDFWVNTYYSDSNRGGQGLSGSNLSFNQYRSGITAGFNVRNSYTPTELIVNYEHGKLNIDEGNQGISSNSVMAGALFPDIKKLFTGTLSAKALIGYSDFSGDRKVLTNDVALNGSRNVTASYQSSHLTIGSAWTKTLYQTDKVILDTLVGIDLNTQHINSYSESDLFKWNGRTINQLQERVTLGMEMKPLVKPLTLFGRVGIERRDLLSGENQNYAINNTAVSYNDSNQRNTYATLNAGAYYPLTPTVKAYAQVRYYDSVKDIDSLSGSIGISGQF